MALKRSMLTGMGLTEEQIKAIIEGHDETVSGLKDQIADMKDKAGRAEELEKQLADIKAGKDWKAEHDKVKADFDAYKADVAGKETAAKVKAAYRKLLKEEKIDEDVLDTVIEATRFDGMKLDGEGRLEDADKLSEGIRSKWGKFVTTTEVKTPPVKTPPEGGKATRTKEEIMAIKDTAERQAAMLENHELFGI